MQDKTKNHQYKLLVVEDEESLRLIYSEYLSEEGPFETITAKDGQDAVKKVKENPDLDMILLDLVLPKKDGLEVLKIIKPTVKSKTLIYIFSQLSGDDVIKKGFELGADGYIIKDKLQSPKDLQQEILAALESHR